MIEIEYYYQRLDGKWYKVTKTFYSTQKAIRFIYKCNSSSRMLYSGDITCDDPFDFELIQRRFNK